MHVDKVFHRAIISDHDFRANVHATMAGIPARFRCLQFGAIFPDNQDVNSHIPGFRMHFQPETLSKKSLNQ